MKIWLLSDYDGVIGAYSTSELADEARKRLGSEFRAEEIDVDEPLPALPESGYGWLVAITEDGTARASNLSIEKGAIASEAWFVDGHADVQLMAHDQEEAIRRSRDLLAPLKTMLDSLYSQRVPLRISLPINPAG